MSVLALRQGLVAIAVADTGPGGLVELTGSDEPLRYGSSLGNAELPITTYVVLPSEESSTSGRENIPVEFTTWIGPEMGALYLETGEAIRDRLAAIMNYTNLAAQGVDAARLRPRKRELTPDDDGILGLVWEVAFDNAA